VVPDPRGRASAQGDPDRQRARHFAQAGRGTVKVKLTSAGRKALKHTRKLKHARKPKHAKKLKLTQVATFTSSGGASAKSTKTFMVKIR
jgi:hypothetical protein